MDRQRRLDETRQSWDHATRLHNAHKRDQAGFFRNGGSTLFPEELDLLGELRGRRVLHLLCNSGQDTLSLVARGASCVGVDLSGEAVAFAQALSKESGIPASFHQSEVFAFLESNLERDPFDLVFASYGFLPWIDDLPRLVSLMRERLSSGGRVVLVDFHPLAWSFDEHLQLADPYFAPGRTFAQPVSDYVGESGAALAPSGFVPHDAPPNPHRAHSYQHTVADLVSAALDAGLSLEALREWPYANGCRLHAGLVPAEGARFTTPPSAPNLPLMLGLVARRRT